MLRAAYQQLKTDGSSWWAQTLTSRKTGTFCGFSTLYPEVSPTWDGKLSWLHPVVEAHWGSIAIYRHWQLPQGHVSRSRRKGWCAWQPDEGVMYLTGGFRETGHHDLWWHMQDTLRKAQVGKKQGFFFFAEKMPGDLLWLGKKTVTLPTEFSSHTLKHQLFFVTVSETACKTEMLCELRGKFTLRTFTDLRQSCLDNSRLQV